MGTPASSNSTAIAAMAELERSVIRERVVAGMEYARTRGTKWGKPIGRPRAIFRRDQAQALRAQGCSWRQIARQLGVSPTTVRRACQEQSKSQDPCQKPENGLL